MDTDTDYASCSISNSINLQAKITNKESGGAGPVKFTSFITISLLFSIVLASFSQIGLVNTEPKTISDPEFTVKLSKTKAN
jgi:hypothetical protein